ncbi:MAG: DUF6263 family protein [Planctomycetota bacterium]
MQRIRICGAAASCVIFILFVTAGCTDLSQKPAGTQAKTQQASEDKVEPAEQSGPVELALKFAAGDSTTYRVIRKSDKSAKWEGPVPTEPKRFPGGHTGNRVEMVYTQQIQSIDDEGNAAAKITIKELKYLAKVRDNVTLEFDSSKEPDPTSPLSKMIGQSYTIEITPSGQVSRVIDAADARAAVKGVSKAHEVADALLTEDAVKELIGIPALPAADKNRVLPGGTWSNIESFSFELMGPKSYERIYTLNEVRKIGNRRVAIAAMNAVPSTEQAKELHKEEESATALSRMFDNKETYTGELKLDLTSGKIENCREELMIEWFFVDPNPKADERPAALRMTAELSYSIERVN